MQVVPGALTSGRDEGLAGVEDDDFRRSLLVGLGDVGLGLVVSDGRRVLAVNETMARMLGRAPADLVGLDTTLLVVAEEREAGLARQDARTANGGSPQSFHCHLLRRDGSRFLAHVTGRPLRGEPRRYLAFVRDLSDEERARDAVEAARRQIAHSEKLSALGSLVSGVAHEIRTPLTYLQNSLFLLQRRLDRIEREEAWPAAIAGAREQLAITLDGVERIARLVDDLRRFTRLTPQARRIDTLAAATREGVALFQATHRGRAVVRSDLAATPDVHVDTLEVQQVVLNLLANACDASPPGHPVRIRTRVAKGGARLEVEDDGIGIPEEVQARMWDPFFTTKSEGTGLGLSIVKRIAESAGADLLCESAPGKGTRFRLLFPAVRRDASASPGGAQREGI